VLVNLNNILREKLLYFFKPNGRINILVHACIFKLCDFKKYKKLFAISDIILQKTSNKLIIVCQL